uniref:cytochrome b n=1 Tax=Halotydeus destructor TaxID=2874060 RepID=UPI002028E572|nr:cytochrome b [Halotydeus destructor]UPN63262.1 cytochrome b [Halotydeus destructor]
MKNKFKNSHPVVKSSFNMLVDLPAPSSISYMWNWGSLLSLTLMLQIMTGLLLASHYNSSVDMAFNSIIHIMRDVNMGWALRMLHMNGASMFFVLIYIHISRGMIFSSYKNTKVWLSGTMILLILMASAFMGYVLPWGQMSFWGATVITNLVSAIPYVGTSVVQWLWGGFSVSGATLSRFFMLHFILPFILSAMVIIHLMSLHQSGSKSPTGLNPNSDKISFHPFFSSKDALGAMVFLFMLITISFITPYLMGDPENFNPANPLNTPIHIQPEWYFLFAYAILRSIPNKLGGVVALVMAIVVIAFLPFKKNMILSSKFMPLKKMWFWNTAALFTLLTWIGANPVEYPFETMGQIISAMYFMVIVMV